MEYYSAIKKNEIIPVSATCMDTGIIILGEVSETETNIIWYGLHVESKKVIQMNLQSRNRHIDLENKLMVNKGEQGGRDKLGLWDANIHTAIFKTDK